MACATTLLDTAEALPAATYAAFDDRLLSAGTYTYICMYVCVYVYYIYG